MYRTPLTLAAAGFAGALALSAAPLAGAQDLPAEVQDAFGATYFLNEAGDYYVAGAAQVAVPYAQLSAADQERAVDVTRAAIAGLIDAPADTSASASAEASAEVAPEAPKGDAVATLVTPEGDGKPKEEVLDADAVDPNNPDPVQGGLVALPSVLTVNGETFYLNADGATYVTDVARVADTPTPEEVEASAKLVAEHSGEVREQGLEEARAGGKDVEAAPEASAAPAVEVQHQAAPAPAGAAVEGVQARGMAAETGSNTFLRALVALVIASGLGAAVFLVGRRYLI